MDLNKNLILNNSSSCHYEEVTGKVIACINDTLLVLINQMLRSADIKLPGQTKKNDISRIFFINLNKSLVPAEINESVAEEVQHLVDQDEMEEMVAITTMHAKAMNIYGEEINHLEVRLEYLEIVHEDIFDKEALDPKHICETFKETIKNIDLSIEDKLLFYKLFDEKVCSKLGTMYRNINQILIDNDIMPEIVLKTTKQEELDYNEAAFSTQVASYYDPEEKVSTDFIPRSKQEISRIVNEFMTGSITITDDELELPESFLRTPTQQDLEGRDCYERKDVLKALSKLQYKLTSLQNKTECLSTEKIKQELFADISKQSRGIKNKKVNILDERNMDFVGMMFAAITDDETVSEIMTNLIYQLQIPVMKVAMSDKSFFEDVTHAARITVDLLTEAGKGINFKEDRLYSELENIVASILEEFDINIKTFATAVEKLKIIIHREYQSSSETERNQQKQIFQENAKHIVVNQLKLILCHKKIPSEVRPLVLKHWSTLMLNRYLRHGRHSSQWGQSVLLLKLLLKCLQPVLNKSQLKLLRNNHTALLEAITDELYATQQDKHSIANQIKVLKSYFINSINECAYEVNDDEGYVKNEALKNSSSDETGAELAQINQQVETAKQKISQLASSTKPGAWYEIYNGDNKAVRRLKLSVILPDVAQLIFVDRKGVKVIEKDAEEFARELKENRSRLLADHSTFDQALGKVIGAMAA